MDTPTSPTILEHDERQSPRFASSPLQDEMERITGGTMAPFARAAAKSVEAAAAAKLAYLMPFGFENDVVLPLLLPDELP